MATKQSESVYRIIDVVGVSEKSWEDAGRIAVETAAGSLRDLRVAEVTKMDLKVDNGKVTLTAPAWRSRSNTSRDLVVAAEADFLAASCSAFSLRGRRVAGAAPV
jgi:flavin-binding protein dodecin